MSIVDHGVPVFSSRQWTTGLSPNAAGDGWNYIAASYVTNSDNPVEWVVLKDLTTAPAATIYETSTHHYPNTLFGLNTQKGQLRASNGRIFFPLYTNRTAYYDPATEEVHELPSLPGTPTIGSNIPYSATFDTAGLLYFATQSSHFNPSIVAVTDPDTLVQTVIGQVGDNPQADTTYGHKIAADTGTDAKYVYVVYGETPWQLWALNATPGPAFGTATKLYEVPGAGDMTFIEVPGKGWTIRIHTDLGQIDDVLTQWWCLDGALYAYTAGSNPPVTARSVTPASNPLVGAPDVDISGGIGIVGWRPEPEGPFTTITYDVKYRTPIAIEALAGTADGVLGNAEQYSGFFQLRGSDPPTWYGPFPGISRGPRLSLNDLVYAIGYPNGVLYQIDPSGAWSPTLLGSYSPNGVQFSGIKYADYAAWSAATTKIYCAGHRERNGTGMGIGAYDIAHAAFSGTFGFDGMESVLPQGLVADDIAQRVIVTTKTISGTGSAPIYIINQALTSATIVYPFEGRSDLGALFPTSAGGRVCGLLTSELGTLALYHFDVAKGVVTDIVDTHIVGAAQTPILSSDGTVWAVVGTQLVQINVDDLVAKVEQDLTSIAPVTVLALGASQTLYMAGGASGAHLYSLDANAPVPEPPVAIAKLTADALVEPIREGATLTKLNEIADALNRVTANPTVTTTGQTDSQKITNLIAALVSLGLITTA